ncbi:MAG TPA: hypothetical protein VII63_02330 [Caulobacteraceae bacterium]
MNVLYSLPAALLLVIAVAIAVAITGAGQGFVRHRFRSGGFVAHNDVGGTIFAVAGTLYAVILGFMTVVAWQHYTEAREIVVLEAGADIDAWHSAVGLPPPARERLRSDMFAYAKIMVDREWPRMRRGDYDPNAAFVDMDALDVAGTLAPANAGESNAQAATLQQLTVMHDARQRRIAVNGSGVSWFEWLVLLGGAMCITSFCWLFGVGNARVHLLMTSTVVAIIVSALVLLFELQYPFRSDIGIGPGAWRSALEHLHQMQAGSRADMRM